MTDPVDFDALLREARQRGGHEGVSETIRAALDVYVRQLRARDEAQARPGFQERRRLSALPPRGEISPTIAGDPGIEFIFPKKDEPP